MLQLQAVELSAAHQRRKRRDPCWPGYHMVGMKDLDGRLVPNCVPDDEEETAATVDPSQYDWWTYQGERPFRVKNARGNRTAVLEQGTRFGMRDGPGDTARMIVEEHGPGVLFTISNAQADRLEQRSRRYRPRKPLPAPSYTTRKTKPRNTVSPARPLAPVMLTDATPAAPAITRAPAAPPTLVPTPPQLKRILTDLLSNNDLVDLYFQWHRDGGPTLALVPEVRRILRGTGFAVEAPTTNGFGFYLTHPEMPDTRYVVRAEPRGGSMGFVWGRVKPR